MIIIETNAKEVAQWLGLQANLLPKATRDAGKEIERETLRLYRRTSATWRHKPRYETLLDEKPGGWSMLAGTDDRIWNYVDKGTRPHTITAINAKTLAFHESYGAKTIAGQLQSISGGPQGSMVYRQTVKHPGVQGRGFTKMIQEAIGKLAPEVMMKRIREWASKKFPLV